MLITLTLYATSEKVDTLSKSCPAVTVGLQSEKINKVEPFDNTNNALKPANALIRSTVSWHDGYKRENVTWYVGETVSEVIALTAPA